MDSFIQYAFLPLALICCIWIFIFMNRALFFENRRTVVTLAVGLTLLSVIFPFRYSLALPPDCPLFITKLLAVLTVLLRLFVALTLAYGIAVFTEFRKRFMIIAVILPPCIVSGILLTVGLWVPELLSLADGGLTVTGFALVLPMASFAVAFVTIGCTLSFCVKTKHLRTAFVIGSIMTMMAVTMVIETLFSIPSVFDLALLSSVWVLLFDMHCVWSSRDAMTGCTLRHYFYLYVDRRKRFLFLSADLNGLKEINDEQGHDAGDRAVIRVAEVFKETYGKLGGRIFRMGGDEFAVVLPVIHEEDLAKMMKSVDETLAQDGIECAVGYAYARSGETVEKTMSRADRNMYYAKSEMKANKK